MKLRFEADQAACFRKGIDCPKSIIAIEIDPAELPADERNLIADRLDGIDVCKLQVGPDGISRSYDGFGYEAKPDRIVAEGIEYADLIAAIRDNQKLVEEQLPKAAKRGAKAH